MKRLAILICTLSLLLDLADDGCFGKAQFVPLHSSLQSSSISYDDHESCQTESQTNLQVTDCLGMFPQSWSQIVTPFVKHILKILVCCRPNSSGGIPL
jgi:hypothetical protein